MNIDPLDGERGLPSINQGNSDLRKRGLIAIIVLGVLVGIIGFVYIHYMRSEHENSGDMPKAKKDIQITNAVPDRTFALPSAGNGEANDNMALQSSKMYEDSMLNKSGSALMVSKDINPPTEKSPTLATVAPDTQGNGGLSSLLSSTPTTSTSARLLKNRNYLLVKGSFIDCVLQTKLDTTVPGMTSCVVTRNIYSDTGKVLLIERGSTISGEYQSNLKQGQARIFVLWNRIKTPNGVVINLDSPGTDSLGGAGVAGYIDNHFAQRYAGAILLSFIQDFSAAAANSINRQGNGITFNNTSDASQSLAAETLRNTINIPPTLYKNQGERIGIYVARDLDFRSVYDLKCE